MVFPSTNPGVKARAQAFILDQASPMAQAPPNEPSDSSTSLESGIQTKDTEALIDGLVTNRSQPQSDRDLTNFRNQYQALFSKRGKPITQIFGNSNDAYNEKTKNNIPAAHSQDDHLDDLHGHPLETEKISNCEHQSLTNESNSPLTKCGSRVQKDLLEWDWEYRSDGDKEFGKIRAEGTFLTDHDLDGDGWHNILSIDGKHNRDRITGLFPAGESIPGNSPFKGDNLIRLSHDHNSGPVAQLSGDGFQFAIDDGSFVNVFFASFNAPPAYLEFHSRAPFPVGNEKPNTELEVWFEAKPDFS